MSGDGLREEWSWSDSDGDGGDALDSKSLKPPTISMPSVAGDSYGLSHTASSVGDRAIKAEVQHMVALGMCSPQAAEMFLQLVADGVVGRPDAARSPIGSTKDQLAATEARLARSERALRESEEQQARLQAELIKTSLSPGHSGGFASLDNARAQREAEKTMALQRRVAEGEARERQQATMQAKMEELLRLQEVALGEREEGAAVLEKEMSGMDAKMRLLTEQLSKMEQALAMEQERNQALEDGIVERDEQLRRGDSEMLRLHELKLEEKEAQVLALEERLASNSGDHLKLQTLQNEMQQCKRERDEAQKSHSEVREIYMSMQSTYRELHVESEHLQMALTIVEPKVHVLEAMVSDIQLHVQERLTGTVPKITSMQSQIEDMKNALAHRDTQIHNLQAEIVNMRAFVQEREGKVPQLQEALEKQRAVNAKHQEELLSKDDRLDTLGSALEQLQFAFERQQKVLSDREARLALLQASLENSQPAMALCRSAIEERDMKINALNVLLHMGEAQVQENVKALDEAMARLKDKDEELKVLSCKMSQLETSVNEKDWQISTHEHEIDESQLNLIDRDQAGESGGVVGIANSNRMLRDSIYDSLVGETYDCVQVGTLSFMALRSLHFGEPRDLRGQVVRTVPPLADEDLRNATLLKGQIAVIERGLCTFHEKASRAVSAGAVGVIFVNSEDELYQPSSSSQAAGSTPIPILCVKKSDGALLADGMTVAMRFSSEFSNSATPLASASPPAADIQHVASGSQSKQPTARQRVLMGATLQVLTRSKDTGGISVEDTFVQVTPTAEILWKDRRCRMKRVNDGFGRALSLVRPADKNSGAGFTVRVEGDKRMSEVYDLALLAASEVDKRQWIAGILEVIASQAASLTPSYIGERDNGLPQGKGLGHYPNGDQYMGEWESDVLAGTDKEIMPLPCGQGVFAWRNGDLYRGQWEKGVRSGFGTLETADGAIYQGEWDDDCKSGAGIQMSSSKEKYVGTFFEGFPHGLGVLTQRDGGKKTVEYSMGVEVSKEQYPHPTAATQASLVENSKAARDAAQKAGEKAQAAQELCQEAEHVVKTIGNQTKAIFNYPTAASTSTTAMAKAPPPSTPGGPRFIQQGGVNLLASPASPINSMPQTPHASMGAGTTIVQSPKLGIVGR